MKCVDCFFIILRIVSNYAGCSCSQLYKRNKLYYVCKRSFIFEYRVMIDSVSGFLCHAATRMTRSVVFNIKAEVELPRP